MKIGIDARMLGTGYGIGRYIEQLIAHLGEIDRENQYLLFLRKENFNKVLVPPLLGEGREGSQLRQYQRPPPTSPYEGEDTYKNFKKVTADIPWYSWEEQLNFSQMIKKEKVDLMHFPHWNVPIFYHDPFVMTIHDLTMYHYPRPEATTLGPLKFWLKDHAHRFVIESAVKRARHIITTSEFTKQDVHKTLGVPLEKMTTIYQAPFAERSKMQIPRDKQIQIFEKYTINKPYILYVGAAYPHKNLEGLLNAWNIFSEKYGEGYQLVLVGKEDYFYQRIKKLQVTRLPARQASYKLQVTFIGLISDEELNTLYNNASLFVFPSLYEGFGLPPLEAMAHGVPVAASNRSCLPEVLGEAALYFDPENYEQMAGAIHRGLTDENLRFELKEKAREELKRFSWETTTRQTLAVYTQ